jgi:pyrroline-5-carboxylate reductase
MGGALAKGIANGGKIRPADILLVDSTFEKADAVARAIGATAVADAKEAVGKCDAVIVAVKPDAVEELLSQIHSALSGKLLISIAAGIPISFLEARTPPDCRVVVAMPNTAMQVGEGIVCYCAGRRATREDAKTAGELLSGARDAIEFRDEKMMDNSYISASGIAFFYRAIDAMARVGEKNGLSRKDALMLAAAAAQGAGAMVRDSGIEPVALEEMVATKKGITVEGLAVLQDRKVADAFEAAMLACIKKAREMREAREKGK